MEGRRPIGDAAAASKVGSVIANTAGGRVGHCVTLPELGKGVVEDEALGGAGGGPAGH